MSLKKILILSSFGGYGHIAAANTLKTLLQNQYEIDIAYPIKELQICGIPSGEAIYNYLISNNWNRLVNWIVRNLPSFLFGSREEKTKNLILEHVKRIRPDVIISLIPFINFPASEAAREFDLPFLMITTDNDLRNWAFALQKRKHTNFKITIGNELPSTKNILLQKRIPEENIETIGLPLRPEFLRKKDKKTLLREYRIPEGKKVVLIVMGGVGARSTYQYVKMIRKNQLNVHLVVCTGKNKRLMKKLKKISPSKNTSIEIIPFTERMDELFALADLVITKPGPGTINEAFVFKIPILIDRMAIPLSWEEANINLVLSGKVGACIDDSEMVPELVEKFLWDEDTCQAVTRAYQQIPKNQFANKISLIIEEMCKVDLPGEVLVSSRNIASPI